MWHQKTIGLRGKCQIKGIDLLWHQKRPAKQILATPIYCYALIRDGIRKGALFHMNAALLRF